VKSWLANPKHAETISNCAQPSLAEVSSTMLGRSLINSNVSQSVPMTCAHAYTSWGSSHVAPPQQDPAAPVRSVPRLIDSLSPLSISSCIRSSAQPQDVSLPDLSLTLFSSALLQTSDDPIRTVLLFPILSPSHLLSLHDILSQNPGDLFCFSDFTPHF